MGTSGARMHPMPRKPSTLPLLSLLYFVQGLPFGFQATALPVYLRAEHVSLEAIGLTTALALPWSLKALWAPFVDRHFSAKWGRRKSWILPMQLLLALAAAGAAWAANSMSLPALFALILLMNLFTSVMDIAVDGLAVDVLSERALGYGNIAQVVGYKLGMIAGGGLLVWTASAAGLGWASLFAAISVLTLAAMVPTLLWREEALDTGADGHTAERPTFADVLRTLRQWLEAREAWWLIAFIATYKFGESMSDTMWKPFLVDSGFAPEQIALWVGTWGGAFSLAGSFAGGILASRVNLATAVAITAILRILPIGGEWWVSLGQPDASAVIAVTCAEHFFGGALTTAVFALMMSRVDRRIAATHYTVIATIEVLGKSPSAWFSGYAATALGYSGVFAAATLLSFAFLALVPRNQNSG
jgi:PAT family beta-lactamase induction signal transducer AmpG